jgi:diketogulonate reductase-like aldo/keto reductase
VIAGQRDRVFLVSKVEANEVPGDRMARACEASLRRLGTDYLDLYLLHSIAMAFFKSMVEMTNRVGTMFPGTIVPIILAFFVKVPQQH